MVDFEKLQDTSHILVAGCSGSGKSYFIKKFVDSLKLTDSQYFLIDTKKVELWQYRNDPLSVAYCDTEKTIVTGLKAIEKELTRRFLVLRKYGLLQYKSHVWIIIDEYADVMQLKNSYINDIVMKVSTIGRAAGIHLMIATQRPTRDIIAGAVATNLETRIGLRTTTRQESKNIIGQFGCESLPKIGYCYILNQGYISKEKF